jgi:hypothetical protein
MVNVGYVVTKEKRFLISDLPFFVLMFQGRTYYVPKSCAEDMRTCATDPWMRFAVTYAACEG